MKKTKQLNIKTTEKDLEQLNRVAEIVDVPAAQIVREAIKEKIAQILEENPEVDHAIQNGSQVAV